MQKNSQSIGELITWVIYHIPVAPGHVALETFPLFPKMNLGLIKSQTQFKSGEVLFVLNQFQFSSSSFYFTAIFAWISSDFLKEKLEWVWPSVSPHTGKQFILSLLSPSEDFFFQLN